MRATQHRRTLNTPLQKPSYFINDVPNISGYSQSIPTRTYLALRAQCWRVQLLICNIEPNANTSAVKNVTDRTEFNHGVRHWLGG